jgi:hypothetical protein
MGYNTNLKGQVLYNGVIVPEGDLTSQLYLDYIDYLMAGGSVDPLNNGLEEIEEQKRIIREDYSYRISNIRGIKEAMERFVIDGTPIPQSIIDEREKLKTQYHNTINSL